MTMPAVPPTVLVVDDEPQMVAIVSFALETQGFAALAAHDAASAWSTLGSRAVDLVILDVMLPDGSGRDLCRRITERTPVPVILLTALADPDDRVRGLEAGADDYVTKPFAPRELALRAQAVLRRTGRVGPGPEQGTLRCGSLVADLSAPRMTWHGKVVPLAEMERRLLVRLMRAPGEVVPLRALLNEVWETTAIEGGRDMVKSSVYRLRHQLRAAGVPADLVHAVRAHGYRLDPGVAEDR
jgi:two-component system phosphate regulon response regulator PhoB